MEIHATGMNDNMIVLYEVNAVVDALSLPFLAFPEFLSDPVHASGQCSLVSAESSVIFSFTYPIRLNLFGNGLGITHTGWYISSKRPKWFCLTDLSDHKTVLTGHLYNQSQDQIQTWLRQSSWLHQHWTPFLPNFSWTRPSTIPQSPRPCYFIAP